MVFYRGGNVVNFTTKRKKEEKRKHDHRTKTEHNLNKNRTKNGVYIIYNFFYFLGGAWYNKSIYASLWKTSQNLQKYLKKPVCGRKKRAKIETYKKHSKMLKSEVFQNIKTKKSKKARQFCKREPN